VKTAVTKGQLLVQNTIVSFTRIAQGDFISLTDIAKVKNPDEPKDVVKNWLRSRSTIDFLGLWEQINNPSFKGVEFDSFKNQAGTNSFTLSPSKWIETTGAIGIRSTAGRTGGTYAHKDIAFEFDYIHTDAIAENIIPQTVTKLQAGLIYASEADVLNIALFGITAKQWRDQNNTKQGNMRDHASVEQLIILSNLESINAELIRQSIPQSERLTALNNTAIHQMRSLLGSAMVLKIK